MRIAGLPWIREGRDVVREKRNNLSQRNITEETVDVYNGQEVLKQDRYLQRERNLCVVLRFVLLL